MVKVGSDIDGVWADFSWGFSKLANQLGLNYTFQSPTEFDFIKNSFTETEQQFIWNAITSSNSFWEKLGPLVPITCGIYDKFEEILKTTDFYFITSRRGAVSNVLRQTHNWILRYFKFNPPFPEDHIIICKAEEKIKYLKNMGFSYYIDDMPNTLKEIYDSKLDINLYGMDCSYTQECKQTLPIKWVKSVSDYLKDILSDRGKMALSSTLHADRSTSNC